MEYLNTEDGCALATEWLQPEQETLGVLVIASATGVRRQFYRPFAEAQRQQGWRVLLWDPRGVGDSRLSAEAFSRVRMQDWGQHDLHAILQHARSEAQDLPLYLLGHSAGGNLAGLAPSLPLCDGLLLVASGTCYWRDYPLWQWPRVLFSWWVWLPLILVLFKDVPAWAGVGQRLPRGVARQWRQWCLLPEYLFDDPGLNVKAYAQLQVPLLALSMPDDHDFAPLVTTRKLMARYRGCMSELRRLRALPGGGRLGHFDFFRTRHAGLWNEVSDWLELQRQQYSPRRAAPDAV